VTQDFGVLLSELRKAAANVKEGKSEGDPAVWSAIELFAELAQDHRKRLARLERSIEKLTNRGVASD